VVNDGIVLHVINHDEIVIGVNSVEGLRAAWKIYCYHGQEFCTVQLEKISMTDLCHGRKVVLNLKCFEIFYMEFINTVFEMLGLIKNIFYGFAHIRTWVRLMHGHLPSPYY
jgi:hypothetical protein